MTIVHDRIAAEIALLPRLVPTPVEPFGYGRDLSCVDDITETMDEVDPFSRVGIAQAALRRLTTPRGSLPDDPEYGIDVRSFLNQGTTASDLQGLQGLCRQELLKDDRILNAAVIVTYSNQSKTLTVDAKLEAADPKVGGFKLTFAVTSGDLTVQELG